MESSIQQGGWIAVIVYLFFKDAIIPLIRKTIPAKVKGDMKIETAQQNHDFAMEQKRLDSEIEFKKSLTETVKKISETQASQVEILRLQGEQILVIANDTKEIKESLKRPSRKAAK